jgi:hydroxymethylbilane synthase
VRSDATGLRAAVLAADHGPTRVAVEAERALLRRIGGGCLAPLGALGEVSDGQLRLRAAYEDADGAYHRADGMGPVEQADAVVDDVAGAVRSA